jgi:hypothetical protein
MKMPAILRHIRRVGAILLAAGLLGAALPPRPGVAETPGPTPGTARIWIYRTFEPSITLATPYIRINGAIVAVAWLGRAFYRDVPPGAYQITTDSPGRDVNQFAHVVLAAGQTVYIKIDPNDWWAGLCRSCQINTFYTRLIPAPLAQAEMASLPAADGG